MRVGAAVDFVRGKLTGAGIMLRAGWKTQTMLVRLHGRVALGEKGRDHRRGMRRWPWGTNGAPRGYPGQDQLEGRARKFLFLLVGAAGFEPATLCSQSRCATRLRHAPTAVTHDSKDASPPVLKREREPPNGSRGFPRRSSCPKLVPIAPELQPMLGMRGIGAAAPRAWPPATAARRHPVVPDMLPDHSRVLGVGQLQIGTEAPSCTVQARRTFR
jgi:hypothetical protein